jgi:Cof subfamily protein (haloacid dehalogenase superfamily)
LDYNQTSAASVVLGSSPKFSMNASFPYRLAAFDMDDTLLGPDKKISDENRLALDRLREAGVEVVVASGRYHDNIAIFEKHLGFQGWVISSGGAVVRHSATGEIVMEVTVPQDLAHELFHRGRELGVSLIAYHDDGIFCDQSSEWTELYRHRTGQVPIVDAAALMGADLQKLIWTSSAEKIAELIPIAERDYKDRLYVVSTEHEMLEFINSKGNKAHAVQALAKRLGLRQEEILAMGDGNNDAPLLAWAGMSVAMAHGRETAKRAAKKVSPPGPPGTAVARSVEMLFDSQPNSQGHDPRIA